MPDYSSRTENQSIKGRDCDLGGGPPKHPRRGADANECEQTIKQKKPEHETEKKKSRTAFPAQAGTFKPKADRSPFARGTKARGMARPDDGPVYTPFNSVEDAWFWFIQAQQARNDGANFVAGLGIPRPCEPLDFLNIMNRLYKNRFLTMDHFKVLRHYGLRGMAPDPERPKEARAWHLWREAFNRLEPVLIRRGIIHDTTGPSESWADQALVYESRKASFTFEDGEWV